jgi:hypothetical protein
MSKIYVEVTTRIIMEVDEDFPKTNLRVGEVISEMDYNFTPHPEDPVDFVDTEILDFEIKDVK